MANTVRRLALALALAVLAATVAIGQINVANTAAELTGKHLVTREDASTITGLYTYSRSSSAPFAVNLGAALVTNLDADKLDGQTGTFYTDLTNATGTLATANLPTVPINKGGTALTASPTNGQLPIGNGTGYTLAVPTAGAGISVTAGAGTLTIANTTIQQFVLLKAGSGTSTAAGATNVDTVAISGLTALDRLVVYYEIESATQTTASPVLYNNTDAATIAELAGTGNNLAAGIQAQGEIQGLQRQAGATSISMVGHLQRSDGLISASQFKLTTFTTNWTGSWTLALRHAGVTAGGTFSYTWSVHKLLGQ